jgi:hypothetical protein
MESFLHIQKHNIVFGTLNDYTGNELHKKSVENYYLKITCYFDERKNLFDEKICNRAYYPTQAV